MKSVLMLIPLILITQSCSFTTPDAGDGFRSILITVWIDKDDYSLDSIDTIQKALDYSSNAFGNLKIRFGFNLIKIWRPSAQNNQVDCDTILADIKKLSESEPRSDIALAYTSKPIFTYVSENIYGENIATPVLRYGCAKILENTAVVQLNESTNNTTLHELLHLFGAKDLFEFEKSVMYSVEFSDIDNKSLKLVLKNRNRAF